MMTRNLLAVAALSLTPASAHSDDDLSWFSSKELSFERKPADGPNTAAPTEAPAPSQPSRGFLQFAPATATTQATTPAPIGATNPSPASLSSQVRRATDDERKTLTGPMAACRNLFVASIALRDLSEAAVRVLLPTAPRGQNPDLPETLDLVFSTDTGCMRPPPNPELARLMTHLRQEAALLGRSR